MGYQGLQGALESRQRCLRLIFYQDDIELVLNNATSYNKPGTPFHKTAQRILTSAQPILQDLERLSTRPPLLEHNEDHGAIKVENTIPSPPVVGDLEPPLDLVELLFSLDAIKDESELILSNDSISSLLSFELPVFKPLPPAQPKPRKAPKLKLPKPDRTEEYKRYRAKKAEERALRAEMEAAMAAAGIPDERLGIRTRKSAAAPTADSTESTPFEGAEAIAAEQASLFPDPGAPSALGLSRSRFSSEMPSVPEFRDDVDNQASFKLFNSGWILPSDQKRRTRAPIPPGPSLPLPAAAPDRSSLPPPKKKIKLDRRGTSKLSVFSTAEEDNETLNLKHNERSDSASILDMGRTSAPHSIRSDTTGLHAPSQAAGAAAFSEDHMDIDTPAPPLSTQQGETLSSNGPMPVDSPDAPLIEPSGLPRIGNIIHANGKIIIEELDSPATRREKHMRRRAEREKLKHVVGGSNVEDSESSIGSTSKHVASDSTAEDSETGIALTSTLTAVAPPPTQTLAEQQPEQQTQLWSVPRNGKPKMEVDSEMNSLSERADEAGKIATPALPPLPEPVVPVVKVITRGARKSVAGPTSDPSSSALVLTPTKASSSKVPANESDKPSVEFKPDQVLEGGTLVWAKAGMIFYSYNSSS